MHFFTSRLAARTVWTDAFMDKTAQTWLDLHCQALSGALQGLVVRTNQQQGTLIAVAHWPEAAGSRTDLADVAHRSIRERRATLRSGARSREFPHGVSDIAVPFDAGSGSLGAVAVRVARNPAPNTEWDDKPIVDLLSSGTTWLSELSHDATTRARMAAVLDIAAAALEPEGYADSAATVATQLALLLECERVSLGVFERRRTKLIGLSHSASFDKQADLVGDLEAAMDEAADQDSTIVHPLPAGATARVGIAHEALLGRRGAGVVWTVPLANRGRIVGAMTFERDTTTSPAPETLQLCEDVGLLLGPVLDLRRRGQESLITRARGFLATRLSHLVEPGHPSLKFSAIAAVALFLLLGFMPGNYRVTANATLEGTVQRAIVAGIDGYISEANVRAGDIVKQGQVLGRLDDRDLLLEHRHWAGQLAQFEKEHHGAFARHDRSQVIILRSQIDQATAQIDLLNAQIERTQLLAPFDGVVVQGDLSQSLGSPVERGQVLFEIAPLDGYRIILEVDERDVAEAAPGQKGRIALSALPRKSFPLTIRRITPVSVAEDGRNFFRVEADLDEPSSALRPGMRGIAKIEIERRPLRWILTHRITDWLRLGVWAWLP
jgi:biotin carboxyl carrier protein